MEEPLEVLLIADTHVPKRAKDLPAQVWQAVDAADVVIHAGDWVETSLLDQLESRSKRLLACWGNNELGQVGDGLQQFLRPSLEECPLLRRRVGRAVREMHERPPCDRRAALAGDDQGAEQVGPAFEVVLLGV